MLLGTGGVGKTTCSVAVACALARRGRRVVLLTVDPARRLEALVQGLGEGILRCRGASPAPETGLDAGFIRVEKMETARLAESYLRRCAPDAETADRLLASRFYPHLSSRLQAMHEYMAGDRILDLLEQGKADHVVVDTPPFAFAMHFLDAPRKLGRMAGTARKVFPSHVATGGGRHPLSLLSPVLVRGLSFFLGREFLSDLVDFVAAFGRIFGTMEERAQAALRMFHEQTSYGVVFVPEPHSTADLVSFLSARPDWLELEFVLANRTLLGLGRSRGGDGIAAAFREEAALGLFKPAQVVSAARATSRALETFEWLSAAQERALAKVQLACPGLAADRVIRLPLLPGGVRSVDELECLAERMGGSGP